ncbi:hypothetical protein AB6A40_000192 [Gnathostoma spinigerum]|uniref:Beta-1,4-galactosyltransferase n=1 Tax=Gnathostoma spinigerum TaxID=75299 RepID=A0ABD6E9T0_9BILA
MFLDYMHPFLMRQRRHYGIFVIEQAPNQKFNRGMLLNVGYTEAMKVHAWNCIVFHDVDLLPITTEIIYECPHEGTAVHMTSAIDKYGFKPPYNAYFGGVVAMNQKEFEAINGYPNLYWGWGGEDDDFYLR